MTQFIRMLVVLLCLPLALPVQGQTVASGQKADQVWNEIKGEKMEALLLQGDFERGAEAFKACQGCHRRGATGSPSGAYPRLAGQHASVLIEQIADIRAGRRINPTMAPFSDEHVLTTAEIADIAAYLQALPIRHIENGKGQGNALDQGKALYTRDCQVCHGAAGEGNARKFIPLLAGQHYGYLLRESRLIRDDRRGNANPDMVKVIKGYREADLDAVSDYISRLVAP